MSVKLVGTNLDRKIFAWGLVEIDGKQHHAQIWPIKMFRDRFMLIPDHTPEKLEDWKSVVWTYGGPKPSQIETVDVKMTDDKLTMVIIWRERGIQPKQEGNREAAPTT